MNLVTIGNLAVCAVLQPDQVFDLWRTQDQETTERVNHAMEKSRVVLCVPRTFSTLEDLFDHHEVVRFQILRGDGVYLPRAGVGAGSVKLEPDGTILLTYDDLFLLAMKV